MIDIEVRAWDKDYDMMVYPKAYYVENGNIASTKEKKEAWDEYIIGEVYNPEENEYHHLYRTDERFIKMLYTGLLDKNKTKIFGGDFIDIDGFPWLVSFCCGAFTLVRPISEVSFFDCFSDNEFDNIMKYEIIGNIHQNPELLEDNQ